MTDRKVPFTVTGHSGGTHRFARRFLFATTLVTSCAVLAGVATVPQSPPGPVSAARLTIEYRAGAFSLLSTTRLVKVIPPSEALPASSLPLSGFWYELQSADGTVVYRRIIPDPVTQYTEGPASGDSTNPEREEFVPVETTFSLMVPDLPGTNHLVLFSSPPGPFGKSRPATAVGRIPVISPSK